ncbi:beta-galactosidase trimerization domain-containing protein [Desulfobacterales bacterium HSG2]|nr:beta-galactosidase trimerization domain-containing protein [Desulfobacterales bacterium HSG2]
MAEVQSPDPAEPVPAISQRPEWNRFRILVWPYKTDVLRDFGLYRKLGIGGFQIDRGAGQEKKVHLSIRQRFPYYVGHAADKGFLHLRKKDWDKVTNKRGLVIRPHSLADPRTLAQMKTHLLNNLTVVKNGYVLACAFDDEISLGRMNNPCDADIHPLSLQWFRKWLKKEYGSPEQLNRQWGTSFSGFDKVMPRGFEQVRKKAKKPPLFRWNLSPWMDFRHFMDFQFASVLSELVQYANSLAPDIPAGFVGAQAPGPWGGYDYAMLCRAVQWMEAYDIHGTNEILRSWWNAARRPRMQTFFSTKNPKLDSWFLWYYMAHGNQAVIAWPEGWFHTEGRDMAPHILANRETFEEIQGKVSEHIVNPKTLFDPDPVGIYYSHPSIRAGWAMDAIVHGKTWPKRTGALDDENQTMGILRKVWCKTLEDLGFQYDFVSYLDVEDGKAELSRRFRVIILPKTVCLSHKEADLLREFVEKGGVLIADYLCGVMDGRGRGRSKGVLDDLFGIIRDESAGYLNGKGLTEIDGEKYEKPYLRRLTYYKGVRRYKGMAVFERGTRNRQGAGVLMEKRSGKGRAVYLNLSPLEYWAPDRRFSDYGREWRKIVSDILQSSGLRPRVIVYENGNPVSMIESLWWKNGGREYLCLVKNPSEKKELKKPGNNIEGITGQEADIRLKFPDTVGLVNLRTMSRFEEGQVFHDRFNPWEANIYEVLKP